MEANHPVIFRNNRWSLLYQVTPKVNTDDVMWLTEPILGWRSRTQGQIRPQTNTVPLVRNQKVVSKTNHHLEKCGVIVEKKKFSSFLHPPIIDIHPDWENAVISYIRQEDLFHVIQSLLCLPSILPQRWTVSMILNKPVSSIWDSSLSCCYASFCFRTNSWERSCQSHCRWPTTCKLLSSKMTLISNGSFI